MSAITAPKQASRPLAALDILRATEVVPLAMQHREVVEEVMKSRRSEKPADVRERSLCEVRAELAIKLGLAVAEMIDDDAVHRD